MKILLVTSEKDVASKSFKEVLLKEYDFHKKEDFYVLDKIDSSFFKDLDIVQENKTNNKIFLKNIQKLHLFSEDKDFLDIDCDVVIFLSKHSTLSKTKTKCFSVHAVGNFGKAMFGGKDKTLVKTDACLIRYLLLNLKKNKPKNLKKYEIKQEATHHGPYLTKKTLFYEIGSDIEDWRNKKAVSFLCKILVYSLINYSEKKLEENLGWEKVCGYGGSHYCTVFNRFSFDVDNVFCFGHVVPSYAIEDFKKNKLFDEIKKKGFAKKILKENLKKL